MPDSGGLSPVDGIQSGGTVPPTAELPEIPVSEPQPSDKPDDPRASVDISVPVSENGQTNTAAQPPNNIAVESARDSQPTVGLRAPKVPIPFDTLRGKPENPARQAPEELEKYLANKSNPKEAQEPHASLPEVVTSESEPSEGLEGKDMTLEQIFQQLDQTVAQLKAIYRRRYEKILQDYESRLKTFGRESRLPVKEWLPPNSVITPEGQDTNNVN